MVVCADGFVCLGNLPEDRFVAFFVESLKGEEPSEFDTTMSQFMECAKACRKAKLDEREREQQNSEHSRAMRLLNADSNASALAKSEAELARITAEKLELECMVDELSEAYKTQVCDASRARICFCDIILMVLMSGVNIAWFSWRLNQLCLC